MLIIFNKRRSLGNWHTNIIFTIKTVKMMYTVAFDSSNINIWCCGKVGKKYPNIHQSYDMLKLENHLS